MTANEAKTRMNDVNAVCAPEVCPAADSRFAFTYAVRYFAYCYFYYAERCDENTSETVTAIGER